MPGLPDENAGKEQGPDQGRGSTGSKCLEASVPKSLQIRLIATNDRRAKVWILKRKQGANRSLNAGGYPQVRFSQSAAREHRKKKANGLNVGLHVCVRACVCVCVRNVSVMTPCTADL